MSKNLTRKGLAFGALVALTSSVVAGSPALAAGEINVVPSAGTSYNAVAGTVFNLKTTFAPGFAPASYEQLKYVVTTDANSAVTYSLGVAALTSTATSVAASTTAVTAATGSASATSVNYIGLKATTASVTSSVSVTAFVDSNNDGALTSGEWNTVRSVTFKKLADITPVVTLSAPATGDTTLAATVAWGDLNVEQANRSGVFGVAAGSTNSSLGLDFKVGAGSFAAGTYSSTTGKFTQTVSALTAGAAVTAQASYATNTFDATPDPDTNVYSSTALGSSVSATAAARTIKTVSTNVVAGANALAAGSASVATAGATETAAAATTNVRLNGAWVAEATIKDASTTPVAVSGASVTGTVSGSFATALRPASTGVTEISVTVNGTKYTTNATLAAASVALTTNASGVAAINISSSGLAADDTITVSFASQNLKSSVTATQKAAVYTVTDDAAAPIVAANKNTAASFAVSVKDQFGALSAATNQRVKVSSVQAGSTIADQYVAISGGKASFAVTPATDDTDDVVVTVALEESTTAANLAVTWAGVSGATNLSDDAVTLTTDDNKRVIKVRAAAYSFSTAPAVALYNNVAPSTTVVNQPLTASALADLAAPTASNAIWAKVSLTGTNAGEKLTVTANGAFLSIDGAAVTANSATKVVQGTVVAIYVASNTTGTKTLTVSNGSVSSTVSVVFAKAVETAGTVVELTAPATAGPGTSFVVSGVVKDKFGNVVDTTTGTVSTLSVTYDGPGIVVPASGSITETNANGAFSFRVILGSNETGNGVVTATYDADGTGTTSAAVTSTVTVKAGVVAASSAASGSTGKFFASATNAAGKKVVVKVDGKFAKSFIGTAAKKVISVAAAKGTKTITIFVGGQLSSTKVVIVK